MTNQKLATQILDYWFAIEFLGQDSYEMCTGEHDLLRDLSKFKRSSASEKSRRKQISVFEKINAETNIYNSIKKQAEDCKMSTWSNLTFYVGKIQRQKCIKQLVSELGITFEQAEKSMDYIPIISFQCTSHGKYIEHSLSLSTIVWSLSQISKDNISQLSELLSEKRYSETLEELEKKYFSADCIASEENEGEMTENGENGNMPKFEPDSISSGKIVEIYNDLLSLFGRFTEEDAIENNIGIKYQLFKDQKARDNYDDDNYMGLSHDFFSSDIKMVKKSIEDGSFDYDTGMLSDIVSYICSPYYGIKDKEKIDFVSPKSRDSFLLEMSEILNLYNAPIAKWPSRYMPALMQQVAINFAVSNKSRGIFEKNGHIFSVNGPPGTGKTTLLKEIIANNIVEKAIVLSKYKEPNDAFSRVKFTGGNYDGAYAQPINGGDSPFPAWYRFKDDCINDYGILVTSCNNTAVENITKELPVESGIIDGLRPITGGDLPDSMEMQEQLGEIRRLFSTSETTEKIKIYKKDDSRCDEYPEIYFTGYAKVFFGSENNDSDIWGLVAAPLGKRSNINDFYYDVLEPIWQDFMMKNESIEEHIPKYLASREIFLAQLDKVRQLQKKLGDYGKTTYEAFQAQHDFSKLKKESDSVIESKTSEIKTIEEKIDVLKDQEKKDTDTLNASSAVCTEIKKLLDDHKNKKKELSDNELTYRRLASESENSVSIVTRIFRKSKYINAIELAQSYRSKAMDCAKESECISKMIDSDQAKYENAEAERSIASEQINCTQARMAELKEREELLLSEVQNLRAEIKASKEKAETAEKEKDCCFREYSTGGELKSGQILDGEFIDKILSGDEKLSTEAQTANPWATEEYNREREKLFYFALQMTKDFFLSSKACRANILILGQYWGLKKDTDSKRIQFKSEDREKMMGSLFNTLFLLTPVISSTFASVGRLLRDIKEPGVIGTLVIDEAGQAQPQMAIGSLFRARRAIIVGDPKQVEPVVTDDLKILKDTYCDPIYDNYKDKSISVQRCADIINPFGMFLDNGTDLPEWLGCPLLVHRRCISPMYEISNRISYNGIMKIKTLPPSKEKISNFIKTKSQWINVSGDEIGGGNHFVQEQGDVVCCMVNQAFEKTQVPDLYIIAPFTSVVYGLCSSLKRYARENKESFLSNSPAFDEWIHSHIGTVHRFQGKEANEVIFVLGCDETVRDKYAVRGFVNSNMVNVAATRAKYRLYIVGNMKVWCNNEYVNSAKMIMETLPIEKIVSTESWKESKEKDEKLTDQAAQLPGADSFVLKAGENEEGEPEYDIDTDCFISTIDEADFLHKDLSEKQYKEFGFDSKSAFNSLPNDVKKNLLMGMKLYYLFEPIYSRASDLDASCCGILFCKGMELYLRKNFVNGLKARFPDFRIRNKITLNNAHDNDFMIGTIRYILRENVDELGEIMSSMGENELPASWWRAFNDKLKEFADKRNECCHPQWFKWQDMLQLLEYEFMDDDQNTRRSPKIGGVFYESEKGKIL